MGGVHSTVSLRIDLHDWQRTYSFLLNDPVLFPKVCKPSKARAIEDFLDGRALFAHAKVSQAGPFQKHAIRMSVSNDDLPHDALDQFVQDLSEHLSFLADLAQKNLPKGCGGAPVASRLRSLLSVGKRGNIIDLGRRLLDQLRIEVVGKTPRYPVSLSPGPVSLTTRLQRSDASLVAVTHVNGTPILAVMNKGVPLSPPDFAIMYWCLAWNDPRSAQGQPFIVKAMSTVGGHASTDDETRLKVARVLIAHGAVNIVAPMVSSNDEL